MKNNKQLIINTLYIMKTKSLTIAILLIIATISSNTVFAAKNDKGTTVITEAKNFNKIEVRGNVEVYMTAGEANTVKVNNNYYGENALVQNQNGTLRISSFSNEPLVVYVTVSELNSIALYDNSLLKSGKGISSIELNVNLYNNATAQIDLEALNANITVNDHAKIDLSGNVVNCNMVANQSSTVNSTNFVAEHIDRKINKAATEIIKADELTIAM